MCIVLDKASKILLHFSIQTLDLKHQVTLWFLPENLKAYFQFWQQLHPVTLLYKFNQSDRNQYLFSMYQKEST